MFTNKDLCILVYTEDLSPHVHVFVVGRRDNGQDLTQVFDLRFEITLIGLQQLAKLRDLVTQLIKKCSVRRELDDQDPRLQCNQRQ